MILGQTGCGKSSLLLAILNEMKSSKHTKVAINGKMAYCSQTPWIMSTTVRNNIILFNDYNEYKFQKAIYYSGL
jgi:ATP-binding cassette, subfamily C (CFTR/MRP), member 1